MKNNNDADIQSGFSSDDDELRNFTPNDNDELVIENLSSAEQQNPTETPKVEAEKTVIETAEKVDAAEERVVEEVAEPEIEPEPSVKAQIAEPEIEADDELDNQDEEYNQNDEEMEKKRAKRVIIVLIVIIALLLLLLGGCVWLYFSKVKPLLEPPVVEVVKDTVPAPVVDTVPQIVEEVVVDTTPVDTVVPAPKVYYPEKRIAGKNKVPTAGWLIGYRATPNEAEAIKTVAELSYIDSIPCGYYWINDARKGKKLFKVYVGPYKTQAEVEAVFPKIKERVADAHIYSEDADLLEMYRQQKQVYTAE